MSYTANSSSLEILCILFLIFTTSAVYPDHAVEMLKFIQKPNALLVTPLTILALVSETLFNKI